MGTMINKKRKEGNSNEVPATHFGSIYMASVAVGLPNSVALV